MSAPFSRDGLLFEWPLHGKNFLVSPKFLFVSLFLHALGFYLFQVAYSPNVSITPPPAMVSLLMPTTPENRALLQWIAAEDPAAIAMPHDALPAQLLDSSYKPSFAQARSLPRMPVEQSAVVVYPPAQDVLPFIQSVMVPTGKPPVSVPVPQNEIRFTDTLAKRTPATAQPVHLSAKSSADLQPASFLASVAPDGAVVYVFLQKSSGDTAMDHEAEVHLARMKFTATDGALEWGTATFFWGSEAFENRPTSAPQNETIPQNPPTPEQPDGTRKSP